MNYISKPKPPTFYEIKKHYGGHNFILNRHDYLEVGDKVMIFHTNETVQYGTVVSRKSECYKGIKIVCHHKCGWNVNINEKSILIKCRE